MGDFGESSKACTLHDVFKRFHDGGHNCLGCNFDECTDLITRFLERHEKLDNIQFDITVYLLLLYLFIERVEVVLDIVQVPEPYRAKHFKIFTQIRKWANFIKHPKSFVLTHHPTYDYEGSGIEYDGVFSLKINDPIVEKYYKGLKTQQDHKIRNKELYELLKGSPESIIVIFPNIKTITQKFCVAINIFYDLIKKNDVYIDLLNDETTLVKYFESEETNQENL